MIKCPYCTKKFKSLQSHIVNIHEISLDKVRSEFPNISFVSRELKKKHSIASKNSGCGRPKGIKLSEEHKQKLRARFYGEKNPFFGKKHSKKTRKLMSKNHVDFTGDKNPFKHWINSSIQNSQLFSEKCKIRWEVFKKSPGYEKWRKSNSEKVCQAMLRGDINSYGRGHKNGWYDTGKKKIFYRSSWELQVLQYCKDNRIKIDPCKLKIEYKDELNISRLTLPDFVINNTIIEIKPKKQIFGRNKIKIQAIKKYCKKNDLKFLLITETELRDLRILDEINKTTGYN